MQQQENVTDTRLMCETIHVSFDNNTDVFTSYATIDPSSS
jgi:hypothetical protein